MDKPVKHYANVTVEFRLPLVGNHTDDNSVLKSLGDALEDFSDRIPTTYPQVGNIIFTERKMAQGGKLKSDMWQGDEATATVRWEVEPAANVATLTKGTVVRRWIILPHAAPGDLELYRKKFPNISFKFARGKMRALLPTPHPNEIARKVCGPITEE